MLRAELIHTVNVEYKYEDNVGIGPDLFENNAASPDLADHLEEFLYVAAVEDESNVPYPGAIFQVPNPAK